MTEIPEHLRKRAEEARAKAEAAKAASAQPAAPEPAAEPAAGAAAAGEGPADETASRIPAHLLERSRAAKAKASGAGAEAPAEPAGGGGGVAVAERPTTAVVAPAPTGAAPVGAGPGGHTQRLLTVVKSGSIQDVKAAPVDKVHTWPHLLVGEFVAALAVLLFTFVFSVFVNAPLKELANFNLTENPAKAPWYFLGLQELLTMFHPTVAGVMIPGIGLAVLAFAPYIDRNQSNKPERRKFATGLMTVFLLAWAVLVITSSFFRGPGYTFIYPWREGLFFSL